MVRGVFVLINKPVQSDFLLHIYCMFYFVRGSFNFDFVDGSHNNCILVNFSCLDYSTFFVYNY